MLVATNSSTSNFRLISETLLRFPGIPLDRVHRIRGELEPADAAGEYETAIEGVELDLMLLGLGPDGHVASLFPGSPQLLEQGRLVTSGPAELEPFVDRVTLTLPALLSARRVVFLVTGAEKAGAVERAFRGPVTDEVPASLLRAGTASIDVFLDAAAAR